MVHFIKMRISFSIVAALLTAMISSPAMALCSGASVQREYREADLVIRARLVSQVDTWNDEPDAAYMKRWGGSGLVTRYGLRPLEVFKGLPGKTVIFFEEHDSGAFYVDIDKDYLLFLNYYKPTRKTPEAARGAVYVGYACGQSKPWNDVKPTDLATLKRTAARRPTR
jgi:hypothetical protein